MSDAASEHEDEVNQASWVSRDEAVSGVALAPGGKTLLRLFDDTVLTRTDTPSINVLRGAVTDAQGAPAAGVALAVTFTDGRVQTVTTDTEGNFAVNTGALTDNVVVQLV